MPPDSPAAPHMSPGQFRAAGHAMVDWIADYMAELAKGGLPVVPPIKPGDILAQLPGAPPQTGEPWSRIAADIDRVVMPGITHWQHPSFFAFFPANGSGPGILGEVLSAGLGVNGMLWATSPSATELEIRMLDWMADMLGLPPRFRSNSANGGGVIQGTASESTLIALLAARRRAVHGEVSTRGGEEVKSPASPAHLPTSSPPQHFTLYTSTQAHSSVIKAAMIAGLADGPDDRRCIRLIDVDDTFAMRPDQLERAIEEDRRAGRVPIYICATVGTTSSTAIDPIPAIGAIARRHNLWLHVDAAHAGAAAICPEHRGLLSGVELADSLCFNPHKWLLTNFDCDLFWTSDRTSLTGALSITPEYLRTRATEAGGGRPSDGAIDYRDWQVPLGRRFRALKLWFVIRHYGVEGLRSHVREHIRLARELESWVRADARFEIVAPTSVNLVCFRLRGDDAQTGERTRALLERVNASGRAYLTHTTLPGVGSVIRLCIGGTLTREEHVRSAWELIRSLV